jgi:hypothetical protein
MRNTADMDGGKPIAQLSISGVDFSRLYDISETKGEVLFFCPEHLREQNLNNI